MADDKITFELTGHQRAVLSSLIVSAYDDARRDGRSGPWIGTISELIDVFNPDPAAADPLRMISPIGGEPFGTQVTFWSENWGDRHALIIGSPKPAGQRERLDSEIFKIVLRSGGMTFADADQLTLGWHPGAAD